MLMEFGDFAMMRRTLLGIKERAERPPVQQIVDREAGPDELG
jgi:hypothetical protein